MNQTIQLSLDIVYGFRLNIISVFFLSFYFSLFRDFSFDHHLSFLSFNSHSSVNKWPFILLKQLITTCCYNCSYSYLTTKEYSDGIQMTMCHRLTMADFVLDKCVDSSYVLLKFFLDFWWKLSIEDAFWDKYADTKKSLLQKKKKSLTFDSYAKTLIGKKISKAFLHELVVDGQKTNPPQTETKKLYFRIRSEMPAAMRKESHLPKQKKWEKKTYVKVKKCTKKFLACLLKKNL